MKIRFSHPTISRRRTLAFTITELMIGASVLMLIVGGVVFSHLFGMRMYQITKAKLGASDEARSAISKMITEIRSAKTLKVGSGGINSFTEVGENAQQKGGAIQIYPGTNTNDFVRYFWDSSDKKLKRTVDGATAALVVANSISNAVVFRAENHLGQILTNNQNNRVISLELQFYQIAYPVVNIGPGQLFDYYQLRTRITRRALE